MEDSKLAGSSANSPLQPSEQYQIVTPCHSRWAPVGSTDIPQSPVGEIND